MVDHGLSLLGILVSIGLSVLAYRQIIGALRERIRAANRELEKTLVRRIVVESYQPTVDELSRLISGKALEHHIKRDELLSEIQLLEIVFTEITESDFLTQAGRTEVLERLSPIFAKAEKAMEEEIPAMGLARADRLGVDELIYTRNRLSVLIGFVASLCGTIAVVIAATSREADAFPIASVISVFIGSLAVITMIFLVYRVRESREEPSARSAIRSALDFEREVISTVTKSRIPVLIAERASGFDFSFTLRGRRVLVEVKAHTHRGPLPRIGDTIERLSSALQARNADEGIIVTSKAYEHPDDLLKNTKIRIMTLREFRNHVVHDSTE